MTAGRRELFRAISGRRSAAQIRAFAWDGDPDLYLPVIAPIHCPSSDQLPSDLPQRTAAPTT